MSSYEAWTLAITVVAIYEEAIRNWIRDRRYRRWLARQPKPDGHPYR